MKKLLIINILLLILVPSHGFSKTLSTKDISQEYYKSYNYEKTGNYNDAIKSLQLVYNTYPKAYGINNRLGYLYRINAQFKNSEHHYKQAILALPDALTPKLGLMHVYLQANRLDDASKVGYQILSIDFYNYYGNLRLSYVLRYSNNDEMAEKILIKMLTRYPGDILFLTELGLLKYSQKNNERALLIMQEVLILDPENVTARSIIMKLEQ